MYLSFEVLAPFPKTVKLFLCRSGYLLSIFPMTVDEDIIGKAERAAWCFKLKSYRMKPCVLSWAVHETHQLKQ